jgi:hypothetical protein
MVKCGILFEVRFEVSNNIYTSFVFKDLNLNRIKPLIFLIVKCDVLIEVRSEFLNNI